MLTNLGEAQKKAQTLHLQATAKVVLLLAKQGQAFRGHDESEESVNRGNFMETLDVVIDGNEGLKETVANLPRNAKYTSPDVQKDLVKATADIVRKTILEEVRNQYFCLVVDEARCSAKKNG